MVNTVEPGHVLVMEKNYEKFGISFVFALIEWDGLGDACGLR